MNQYNGKSHNHISVAGLQRSGTNYFETFLIRNFSGVTVRNSFWKHSLPNEVISEELLKANVALIVRHPVMWLQSCVDHNPADILSTRKDFFDSENLLNGYAKLYNTFVRDWLTHVDEYGGAFLRHEDFLRGDFSGIAGLKSVGQDRILEESKKYIVNVQHSIEYSNSDYQRNSDLICHLCPDSVEYFWNMLDDQILGRLSYRFKDLKFTNHISTRTIAYRLLREPHLVAPEDFMRLVDDASSTFALNFSLLCAIAKRFQIVGDIENAEKWYKAGLDSITSQHVKGQFYLDKHIHKMEQYSTHISLIEGLQEIRNSKFIHNRILNKFDDSYRYRQFHNQTVNQALRYIEAYIDSAGAMPNQESLTADDWIFYSQFLVRDGRVSEAIDSARRAIAAAPDNHAYVEFLGSILLGAERYEDAEALLSKDWGSDPRNSIRHQLLSRSLEGQGRFSDALIQSAEAVRGADSTPHQMHHYGALLLKCGFPERAVGVLGEAIQRNPAYAGHHLLLSEVFSQLGRTDEALFEAGQAEASPTAEPWHIHHHGALLASCGRLDEAESKLRDAIAAEPDDARHRLLLSEILQQLGHIPEALAEAAHTVCRPDPAPQYLHHYGALLAEAGFLDMAAASLREAIRGDPTHAGHHLLLSKILDKLGRKDEALLEAALAEASPTAEPRHFHHYCALLASQGRLGEVESKLRNAIAAEPQEAEHRQLLSEILRRRGKFGAALIAAEDTLLCPNSTPWHYHWHGTLLAESGRLVEAESALRCAVGGDASQWRSRIELSTVLHKLGRLDEALAEAEKAISLPGASARVFRHHGMLLTKRRRFVEARASLRQARTAGLSRGKYLAALGQVIWAQAFQLKSAS